MSRRRLLLGFVVNLGLGALAVVNSSWAESPSVLKTPSCTDLVADNSKTLASVRCVPFPDHDISTKGVKQLRNVLREEGLLKDDQNDPPALGIALSGGGTRAASVAMGALAQLQANGVLDHVDAISSVSGGGYAAYFYFSKLNGTPADGSVEGEVFSDMLWTTYTKGLPSARCKAEKCAPLDKEFVCRWATGWTRLLTHL